MLLTLEEGRALLRIDGEENDPIIQNTLAGAVSYLKEATGRDWDADSAPHPVAQAAAGMLLIQWFDQPSGLVMGTSSTNLSYGLTNLIKQLQCIALEMEGSA